jgi:hypothetical protein
MSDSSSICRSAREDGDRNDKNNPSEETTSSPAKELPSPYIMVDKWQARYLHSIRSESAPDSAPELTNPDLSDSWNSQTSSGSKLGPIETGFFIVRRIELKNAIESFESEKLKNEILRQILEDHGALVETLLKAL